MIKVAIVDDHPMVVEGIRTLLENDEDIQFIGSASTVALCKAYLIDNKPDVLLMDINLPDGDGIDLCKYVSDKYPAIYILGISTFNQGSYIASMLANGASGYILKNASKKELKTAIFEVKKGNKFLTHETAQTLKSTNSNPLNELVISRREKEVLLLIAEGMTNSDIADQLDISVSTVDTYHKSLLAKLQAKNTAELIKIAFMNKIIEIK
jgi:DNA-binding NarL/FixJ family response regulator